MTKELNAADYTQLSHDLQMETQKLERYSRLRDTVERIGSLAQAETEARAKLDAAKSDLVTVQGGIEAAAASVEVARTEARQHIENATRESERAIAEITAIHKAEVIRMDGILADKRAAIKTLTDRYDELRAAAVA